MPADIPAQLGRCRHPAPPGIVVRSDTIREDEISLVRGIPCTTPPRTAYDIGRRLQQDTAVIRIDALLNATRCTTDEVAAIAKRYPGARGTRRLRSALALVDAGAQSLQETKTRLLLVRAGRRGQSRKSRFVTNAAGSFAASIGMAAMARRERVRL
jgi:hypothetical protein